MAANFGELKAQVARWLHKSDLATDIPTFINGGLARANLELAAAGGGLLAQEQEMHATLRAGVDSLTVPPNYISLRHIKIGDSILESVDYNTLLDHWGDNTDSAPQQYAIQNSAFYFRPIPTADCDVVVSNVSGFAPFVNDADKNYLLTAGGNLLLYAALLEASPYLADDARVLTWERMYGSLKSALLRADRNARRGPKDAPARLDPLLTRNTGIYNILTDLP
jgi:hypothetical protein